MTKLIVFFLAIICPIFGGPTSVSVSTSIVDTGTPPPIDATKLTLKLTPAGTYKKVKDSVLVKKKQISNMFINAGYSKDSLYKITKNTLEECIINKLVPFWYGTPWDFNGYTATPNKGVIACGYFVSTILLHAGFSLNRYTLAQQNPYLEAVSIQLSDSIQIYRKGFTDFYTDFKNKNSEGLYFAGLDCHVGFLLYRNNKLLFIHSSYIDPLCVTIENVRYSLAFTASQTYCIAEISTNRKLLEYWLNDKIIMTRTK
jgi:hypothetical protein